jgi:hypothetical protein
MSCVDNSKDKICTSTIGEIDYIIESQIKDILSKNSIKLNMLLLEKLSDIMRKIRIKVINIHKIDVKACDKLKKRKNLLDDIYKLIIVDTDIHMIDKLEKSLIILNTIINNITNIHDINYINIKNLYMKYLHYCIIDILFPKGYAFEEDTMSRISTVFLSLYENDKPYFSPDDIKVVIANRYWTYFDWSIIDPIQMLNWPITWSLKNPGICDSEHHRLAIILSQYRIDINYASVLIQGYKDIKYYINFLYNPSSVSNKKTDTLIDCDYTKYCNRQKLFIDSYNLYVNKEIYNIKNTTITTKDFIPKDNTTIFPCDILDKLNIWPCIDF